MLLLAAVCVGPLLLPIRDPDFFWHLKTGEWIWQNRALPGEFLFAALPPGTPAATQRFTMTSYWLSQIGFHLAHGAGGMPAIVLLRFVLFGLLLWLLRRSVAGSGLSGLGLLLLSASALAGFPPERPQYLSFVFAALLLPLLEGFRTARTPAALRGRALAVPLLLLVWANCHGGYLVGLGLVGLVVAGEGIKRLNPRLDPLPPERWRMLAASGVAGLFVSFLNPNGGYVFRFAALPAWLRAFIAEYQPTTYIYRNSDHAVVVAYWLLLALAAAALALRWRRPDPVAIALTAVTGFLSFTQYRFIPFFVVVALPVVCRSLPADRGSVTARAARTSVVAAAFLLVVSWSRYARPGPPGEIDPVLFPVEAAKVVERGGLRGNVFGHYDWGGYLLWRLAPAKLFIDGRNADRDLLEAYRAILTGEAAEGGPTRKDLFAAAGVRVTVTDFYDPFTGELRGLIDDLLADPAWEPVYSSPKAVVFAEATPENRESLRRIAIPRRRFAEQLLDYCSRFIAAVPGFVPPYVARGDLLLRFGDREGALRSWRAALQLAPDHRPARERIESLSAP